MNVPVKLHRIRNMVQYFIYASKKFSLPNLGQPINEHSLWPIVKRDYRESKCSGWQHKLLTMKWYEVGTISGEGNGNPLQYSCWENPRVGGAWWAAVYGIAQGQTWLKCPLLCLVSPSSLQAYPWLVYSPLSIHLPIDISFHLGVSDIPHIQHVQNWIHLFLKSNSQEVVSL